MNTEKPNQVFQFQKNITSLYLNQRFSDITFLVQGEKIHAHKVILAVGSTFFEGLLFGGLKEAHQKEITLTDISTNEFKTLLKFLYNHYVNLKTCSLDFILNMLDVASKFCINDLELLMCDRLVELIDIFNVHQIIQKADLYNLTTLYNCCLSFIDKHPFDFLRNEDFKNQPQEILVKVLKRDSFRVPEIEIFKAVAGWYKDNGKTNLELLKCVRFSFMTSEDIYLTVKPTELVNNDVLMDAIGEVIGAKSKTLIARWVPLSVLNVKYKAQVLNNQNSTDFNFVLNGNRDDQKFVSFPIETKDFVIKLEAPSCINNINVLFYVGPEKRTFRYYIESSLDGTNWKKIVNYSNYDCRAFQQLYFKEEVVQFIKLVGTYNSAGDTIDVVNFEAYLKDTIPKLVNDIVCPSTNVALLDKHAIVIEGRRQGILFGNKSSVLRDYTYHKIGDKGIIIQFGQPYMIDTISLRLWDREERFYRYYIESSTNKSDWTTIVDKRNEDCRTWQFVKFVARVVVYLKLTGTECSSWDWFDCCYIECTSKDN